MKTFINFVCRDDDDDDADDDVTIDCVVVQRSNRAYAAYWCVNGITMSQLT